MATASLLPHSLAIDHGPADRRVRCDLALSATPPLNHENYAVAETNIQVPIQQRFHARSELRRMPIHDGFEVSSWEDYSLGLGLFSFPNEFVRDTVVGRTYMIREGIEASILKYDEALNMRPANLGEERWIMMFNYIWVDYWVEKTVWKIISLAEP
jgi:hypothetical protein